MTTAVCCVDLIPSCAQCLILMGFSWCEESHLPSVGCPSVWAWKQLEDAGCRGGVCGMASRCPWRLMHTVYKHPVCFEGSFLVLLCGHECRCYCWIPLRWPLRELDTQAVCRYWGWCFCGACSVRRLFSFKVILRILNSFLSCFVFFGWRCVRSGAYSLAAQWDCISFLNCL